jgi:enterobactin synthetase component D
MAVAFEPVPTHGHSAALDLALTALAPAGVVTAVELVPTAEGRTGEHAAGRRAAVRALATLGVSGTPQGPAGSRPVWPDGIVGSISHAGRSAAAAVAWHDVVRAIGLDLDRSGALPADDAAAVCSPAERRVLEQAPAGPERDARATLLWVAKEAAFKAWDPWADGALWGVDPALLAVTTTDDGRVRAEPSPLLAARLPGLPRLMGGWRVVDGLAVVLLTASPGR